MFLLGTISLSLFLLLGSFIYVANGWITVSSSEWGDLSRSISGKVLLPTDEDYASDYALWSSTFDDVYPTAIVKCESAQDVLTAYNLILEHFEPDEDVDRQIIAVRSGSHSMIGASTTSGIVIDVSGIQTLELTSVGTAIVAPGINLSTFTAWAEEHDVTLPHGDCASVTFGGFLQGGGLGLTSRTFGMGADWVQSFDIVTANGELVTATADNEYADLFWATLGGGGGNFGIITQYEMNIPTKTQQSPGLYVELTWELTQENWMAVSAGWKQFMNTDNYQDHFATYLRIQPVTYLTQEYYVGLHGFWTGEQTSGLLVLAELLSEINITPATAKIDLNVHFEGWIETSSSDRVRYSSQCKSRWAFEELDSAFFDKLYGSVTELIAYEPEDTIRADTDDASFVYPTQFVFIAPADGAIQTKATREDISFPFRDAKYFFAMCGRWRDGYTQAESKMKTWLSKTVQTLEPHLSSYSFVSFPDWDLEDWQHAYFRDSYEVLQEIKAKYDPDYMFRYSQSIVPANWPSQYADNSKYQLSFQRASYNGEDDTSAATANANADASLYQQWENEQIIQKELDDLAERQRRKNKYSSVENSFLHKTYMHGYPSWVNIVLVLIAGLLVGYGVFYWMCRHKRNGYKSVDDFDDGFDASYEPLRRDTAIAL